MTSKNQDKLALELYKAMIEKQFSYPLKDIQIDGGGEFQFLTWQWNQFGILHRVTCPHTSDQNGSVEGRLRIIVEGGLALLL